MHNGGVPTKREREIIQMFCGISSGWRYPTLDEVRTCLAEAEKYPGHSNRLAWLRAAERRMAAGATSPFEARSESEEVEHG